MEWHSLRDDERRGPGRVVLRDGEAPAFEPVRLLDVELAEGLPPIPPGDEGGRRYPRARSLVRLHGRALGVVELAVGEGGLSSSEHAAFVWSSLGREIASHLERDGLPSVGTLPAD